MTRSEMVTRFVPSVVGALLVVAVAGPERSMADHLRVDPTVEARIGESTGTGHKTKWQIIVDWNVNCSGGGTRFDWDIKLIDQATGLKYFVDAAVRSSRRFGSRTVNAPPPPLGAHVYPEIFAHCHDDPGTHASPGRTARGTTIRIPGQVSEGGGDGTNGGGGGGGGTPDPAPGPCANTEPGTGGDDVLIGTPAGDRLLGFAGNDRLRGLGGADCLFGGKGEDRLRGEKGGDRLVGGPGKDKLAAGPGRNRLIGGKGFDRILARNDQRDVIRCGPGHDLVIADRKDKVTKDCEVVRRR